MHVLLIPVGSAGDVYPYVRLGAELRKRGHQITLVANEIFGPLADTEGFNFLTLGSREEYEQIVADPTLWDKRRGGVAFVRQIILPFMQRQFEVIKACVGRGECDVVVAAGQAIGARIAQEKLEVPLTTVHLSPYFFRSVYRNRRVPGFMIPDILPPSWKRAMFRAADFAGDWAFGGEVNAFRAELGLPQANAIFWDWWNSPQLILAMFPEWFAAPQPDWPSQTRHTGFPIFDPASQGTLSTEVTAFLDAGERPIVFTPGTAMSQGSGFFATSLEAVKTLGCRAIFVSQFPDQMPAKLPESVFACRYAPFGQLLPRAAAIVHHGGIGTISQAMVAGVPQLVRPIGFDQTENASRLEELGIGESLSSRRYSISKLVPALGRLLNSASVRTGCLEVANRFPEAGHLKSACQEIEALGNKRGSNSQQKLPALSR
jgi:UDP:flavonoid glycosyltransferase YjiC (YdhE family)